MEIQGNHRYLLLSNDTWDHSLRMKLVNCERTWKPLGMIGADDPVMLTICGKEHGQLDKEEWRQFPRPGKKETKFFHLLNQAKNTFIQRFTQIQIQFSSITKLLGSNET